MFPMELAEKNILFQGIPFGDLLKMLSCLSAKRMAYKKNDVILLTGDVVNIVGWVISGCVRVVREDIEGEAGILAELPAPNLFCEVFACAELEHSPISIVASEDCDVLLMDYKRIAQPCNTACRYHNQLIMNLLRAVARKSLLLNQKVEILSKRSIRERILSFLDTHRDNRKKFNIPYNREEMARYLCIDRSALSRELCKMRDDKLIKFERNTFEILGE